MKKLIALIMCSILMLTGCKNDKASNKNVSSKETSQNNIEKVFDVDKKGLESKGYENLADIAYGRITEIEGKITVFLAYYQNEPEISFYLLAKIMQLLDNNVNFLITWDSKDYDINEEKINMYKMIFKFLLDNINQNRKEPVSKGFILDSKDIYIKQTIQAFARSNLNRYKMNVTDLLNDIEYRNHL